MTTSEATLLNDRLSIALYNGGIQEGTTIPVDYILVGLKPGTDPYAKDKFHCSKHGKNFDLLLKSDVSITITHFVVFQAPSFDFTSPLTSGALHAYSSRPSWEELDMWIDLEKEDTTEGDSPHLFFKLKVDEPYLVVSFEKCLTGKYFHVKFISAVGNNINIGRLGFFGYANEEVPNQPRVSLKSILHPPSVWQGKITHELLQKRGSHNLICLFGGCDTIVKMTQFIALRNSLYFTQNDTLFLHCTPHDPLSEDLRRELGVGWDCLVSLVRVPVALLDTMGQLKVTFVENIAFDYYCSVEPDTLNSMTNFLNGQKLKAPPSVQSSGVVNVTKATFHDLVILSERDFLVGVHTPELGISKLERTSSRLHFLAKHIPQISFGDFDLEHSRLDSTYFTESTFPIFKFFPHQKDAVTYSGPSTLSGLLNFLRTHATATVDWEAVKLDSDRLSSTIFDWDCKPQDFVYPPAAHKSQTIEEAYEILEVLGKGGFATVKKARNKTTGDLVALKIIPKKDKQKSELQRLEDEIAILQKLSHPNIITLLDVYEDDESIYLVLELATGGDLVDKLTSAGGTFPEQEVANVIKQVLLAIRYMHSKGISHRDLKPANLLCCGPPNFIRVTDFGISKNYNLSLQTSQIGTPGFFAPEILSAATNDNKVDLWSLGVITYILLCGYNPFGVNDCYQKILNVDYTIPDALSPNAKAFIRSLLVKDPNQRPSAAECLKSCWITELADPLDWELEDGEEEKGLHMPHLPPEMVARVNKRILNCVLEKVIPELRNNSVTLLSDAYWAWGLKCNVDVTVCTTREEYSASQYLQFCIGILLKEVERILGLEFQQFILSDQSFQLRNSFFGHPSSKRVEAHWVGDYVNESAVITPFVYLGLLSSPLGAGVGLGTGLASGILSAIGCGALGAIAGPVGVVGLAVIAALSEMALTSTPHKTIESEAVSLVLKALEEPATHKIIINNIELILQKTTYTDEMLERQKAILCSSQVNFGVTTTFDTWRVISVKVDENSLQSSVVCFNILVLDSGTVKSTTHRFSQCRQMYLDLCSQFPDKVEVMNAFPPRAVFGGKDLAFLMKRSQDLLHWLKQCEEDSTLSQVLALKTFLGVGQSFQK